MKLSVSTVDLTEIGQLGIGFNQWEGNERLSDEEEYASRRDVFQQLFARIKTEFAFFTIADRVRGYYSERPSLGSIGVQLARSVGLRFRAVRLNWHYLHHGDIPICLFFGRVPNGKILTPDYVRRIKWAGESNWGAFGCGTRFVDMGDGVNSWEDYQKFIRSPQMTLVRYPYPNKVPEVKWLREKRFRRLARGEVASFWVNGFKSKEWTAVGDWEYTKEQFPSATGDRKHHYYASMKHSF